MHASLVLPEISIAHTSFSITLPKIEMQPGEILGMFGKSGAGKTSYLKRIREHFGPERVHYMSQYDGLFEEITIKQNIELGLALMEGTVRSDVNWPTVHEKILRDFEVDRHLQKYPRMMSGGQRKRAEIVRALLMQPDILLLDEPFLGIGHLFEAVCTREILRRSEEQQGVSIIVSHDLNVLCSFSSRILLLDDQGIIGFMPTKEKGWMPSQLREAWTIGMENVLSFDEMRSAHLACPFLQSDASLGFFLQDANWNQSDAPLTFSIDPESVVSIRTTLHSGSLVSHVELKISDSSSPVTIVGKGSIDRTKPFVLGVQRSAVLR
jgi:ABC-type nitrate/sulfonate/bicarbonate transport system ATPase subunit